MATLMLGGSLGMMLGFVGGGFVAEAYGWRMALVSVGVPGLLLALVMAKLLQEPARGTFETQAPAPPPPIRTTAAAMWSNRAMRHLNSGLCSQLFSWPNHSHGANSVAGQYAGSICGHQDAVYQSHRYGAGSTAGGCTQ